MNEFTLIATCAFGIESIVSDELRNLGFEDLKVENGKITFKSNMEGIALCNIKLRTADRILLKIAEFKAETFDELFDETEKINWHEFIPENSKMHVNGKSIKSTLFSVPNCQGIVKKAIIENMKKKYNFYVMHIITFIYWIINNIFIIFKKIKIYKINITNL